MCTHSSEIIKIHKKNKIIQRRVLHSLEENNQISINIHVFFFFSYSTANTANNQTKNENHKKKSFGE